jgi:hypothetical protein
MDDTKRENMEDLENINSDPESSEKSVISLIKGGKLIDFNYKILTLKQNEVLKKYLRIILDGGFWRKGKGENFTNNERQLIHSIKGKIKIFPTKKERFEDKEEEISEIKEVLEYLASLRK